MRIAFVGKGGSGKTTLASLFCRRLVDDRRPVIAIDADINQHLAVALGMPEGAAAAIPGLGEDLLLIKEWLRGSNGRILSANDMMKTTPPGTGSRLLTFAGRNPIFSTFGRAAGGALLLATGAFCEDDIGVKCYHSKTGAVELILNHLVDGPGQYVVVDMTAGADSFASGLFTKFDLTVLVAEPTKKSLTVLDQYRGYAKDYGVRLAVVGNKVESQEDVAFLKDAVGDALLGAVGRSAYVRAMERGEVRPIAEFEPENAAILDAVRMSLDGCEKDWAKFHRQAIEFHEKNALSWGNASAGRDLREQIDPSYDFPAQVASIVKGA